MTNKGQAMLGRAGQPAATVGAAGNASSSALGLGVPGNAFLGDFWESLPFIFSCHVNKPTPEMPGSCRMRSFTQNTPGRSHGEQRGGGAGSRGRCTCPPGAPRPVPRSAAAASPSLNGAALSCERCPSALAPAQGLLCFRQPALQPGVLKWRRSRSQPPWSRRGAPTRRLALPAPAAAGHPPAAPRSDEICRRSRALPFLNSLPPESSRGAAALRQRAVTVTSASILAP